MKRFVLVFLLFISSGAYAKQAEKLSLKQIESLAPKQDVVFICKIEASTGYAYEDGKWRVTQFETGEKFLLRELSKDDPGFNDKKTTPYGVFDIGEKVPRMYCTAHEDAGSLSCKGIGELSFSLETGQFLRIDPNGAVHLDDIVNKAYPKMMHGSCLLKREVNL